MGYCDYMKQLLSPLRIYNLDSGPGAAELEIVGKYLDGLYDDLLYIEQESQVLTAENEGLSAYESILPYTPLAQSLVDRRNAVAALLKVDEASFTLADINATLIGCGIPALAEETDSPDTVTITFPGQRGVPDEIEQLKLRIESILPCHLVVEYKYVYATWADVEGSFAKWRDIDRANLPWSEMERLELNK